MDSKEGTTEAAENTPTIALKFAPAWKRILSFIIDKLILSVIVFILIAVIYRKELFLIFNMQGNDLLKEINDSLDPHSLIGNFFATHQLQIFIAQIVIEASYFTLSWRAGGQTIGARIMKILVMTIGKKRLSILQGLIRYTIIYISSLAFYLLQIIVFNPIYHQRIHDFFSASVVVEVPFLKRDEENKEENSTEN